MSYETILVERKGAVTLITLNRPQALNALNSQVLADLLDAFGKFDADPGQRCAVIKGSDRAFAAGADIKEMSEQSFADMYGSNFFAGYARLTQTRQPEIKLAVTPGMGGSQRLTKAVGKAKAMEMCLTGRNMDAREAEASGLVARVVPLADLEAEALKTAETIAAMAPLAVIACKEMVNAAFETMLDQGVNFERRLFHGLFGTADQKEGMAAFIEKRPGNFTGK